jgi:hypothetical protein
MTVILLLKYWTKGSKNPTLDSCLTASKASCFLFPNLSAKTKLSIINPRSFQVFPPSLDKELWIFLLYLILGSLEEGFPIDLYEQIISWLGSSKKSTLEQKWFGKFETLEGSLQVNPPS